MKLSAMAFLGLTSLILLVVVLFVLMDLAFSWVFYLTVGGQVLLILTVYKILTDDYDTDKTFDDFYGDEPINR